MTHALSSDSNSVPPTVEWPRPAWVEVDLGILATNFRLIRADLPAAVQLLYVVKDEAYGMGAVQAGQVALRGGATHLAVYTLEEGAALRGAGIRAPILILGERVPEEVAGVLELSLIPCVSSLEMARRFSEAGIARGRAVTVHVKINTGMNRFGLPWRDVSTWAPALLQLAGLEVGGVLSHFAQSDEEDKTFARLQRQRFEDSLAVWKAAGGRVPLAHLCNSGGFLDLPEAHFDMVRVGLLAGGVYPSSVCRRIPGIRPALSVRTRVIAIQPLEAGDTVGYGMRWRADRPSRIAVLPVGYGDGFPRVRNQGSALIAGRRVPLVGGVAMDALTVDITDLPDVVVGAEAVLMGCQGNEEITAQELARLKQSVTYDVLVGWRRRLPRLYRNAEAGPA
jgi:alanine racemase